MTTRDPHGRFIKGQSGNPKGSFSKEFSVTALIRARVEQRPDVVTKLFEAADKGEAWAIQYIIDRIDGKPRQSVETNLNERDLAWLDLQRDVYKAIKSDGEQATDVG